MLLRLVSAVQMWHSKTPISVLNCLLSKHLFSYWNSSPMQRKKTWVKPWLCCSGRRCCLAIYAAQIIEVCRTALFRANELDSTWHRV